MNGERAMTSVRAAYKKLCPTPNIYLTANENIRLMNP